MHLPDREKKKPVPGMADMGFRWKMLVEDIFFVGVGTVILSFVMYRNFGFGEHFLWGIVLNLWLLSLSAIDIRYGKIFNRFLLPMGLMGIAWAILRGSLAESLIAAAGGGSLLLVIRIASRGGMGGGDIKAGFVLGLWLGRDGIAVALSIAFLLGAAVGIMWKITKPEGGSAFPFGPFLSLGAYGAFLWGNELSELYGVLLLGG